jgi:RNA polymerase sigma factor (sigma-70 family)
VTETPEQWPDAALIAAVREGDVSAFAVLYERHLPSAKRAAACLAATTAEREDLVAEAFTRVLRMLREGRGPGEEFRPYLLVTLRNTAIHATTRGAPVSLYADVPDAYVPQDVPDPVIDRWHAGVAADAFASLPERWRVVLWHTEVENESPASVAPLLGMRPNSVSALAYRAREGLRQAYLRMQVPEPPRRECRPTVSKLAGWVRHSTPRPLSRKIDRHLAVCAECRERAAALTAVNAELGGLLGPAVLGTSLAAAYLPAPAVMSGAMAGAVSGAVSGAASSAVPGAVGGAASTAVTASTAVSGGAVAVASETAAVSGLLAVKAAVVQVAAALAVTATAVTVTSSAPGAADSPLAARDRASAAAHVSTVPGRPDDVAVTAPGVSPANTSAAEASGGDAVTKQAAKEAAKSAKQARKADRKSGDDATSGSGNAATASADTGTKAKPGKAKGEHKAKDESKGEPPGKAAGKKPAKDKKK